MKKSLSAILAAALLAATGAYADAVLTTTGGEIRVDGKAAVQSQRVFSGNTVVIGPNSMATLRFDDDMQIVLNENTTFRITDFRYRAREPRSDRAVFDLLRGALRFISGVVGARNKETVALRVPQATVGIRGTDFMVALVNPAYVNVLSGSVTASNSAGTVAFGKGAIGQVASTSTLATPITAAQLPAAASSAFANLAGAKVAGAAAPVAAQGASAGAAAGGSAAPTAGVGAAAAVGIGAAIVATAVDSASTPTHH